MRPKIFNSAPDGSTAQDSGSAERSMSRRNHARANAQSRRALRAESPIIGAASSAVRPEKKRSFTSAAAWGRTSASRSSARSRWTICSSSVGMTATSETDRSNRRMSAAVPEPAPL